VRILVAEDETVSRRLLQASLEKWGHRVTVAEDGAEAWGLFQQEPYPIVLTDWMMPGMDGLELVRRIRSTTSPHYVFIILLTARADKSDVIQGMEAGADDFVTKPFDRQELRARLLAGERILHLERTLADHNRVLRETQAALVQTEKLASLGQLAAGMAHEINNPLAYVSNNVAVLQRDVPEVLALLDAYRSGRDALAQVNPELVQQLNKMEEDLDLDYVRSSLPRLCETSLEGLRRVGEIVRNLRDFARVDQPIFQETDLNEAVSATLEIVRYEVKKKDLHLEAVLGSLPQVQCYPGKINQVLLNMVMNAIQACDRQGHVQVRTRVTSGKPDASATPKDIPLVVFEVQDDGCGIAAEHMAHLFDPFFTTKPPGMGTGLGLAVSYGIVRDHGGSIEVESEPGQGTRFRVFLPVQGPENPLREGVS
jgi:two-component system NtrC family sensor kinase